MNLIKKEYVDLYLEEKIKSLSNLSDYDSEDSLSLVMTFFVLSSISEEHKIKQINFIIQPCNENLKTLSTKKKRKRIIIKFLNFHPF